MADGYLTYIGECGCPREYILAALSKPKKCVVCGERPLFKRPDPDCWVPGPGQAMA